MTAARCDHWHGLLAMRAIGRLDEPGAVALDAHLEGCPECRLLEQPLDSAGRALALVSPAHLDDVDPLPAGLADAVFSQIHAERQSSRWKRRGVAVLASAAAAVVAVVLLITSLGAGGAPAGHLRSVTFAGPAPGVTATATLSPSASGTDLQLRETGQKLHQSFTVSMQSASGRWWNAGSYRTDARTVSVRLSCAVAPASITAIWVQDSSGHTVLTSYLH